MFSASHTKKKNPSKVFACQLKNQDFLCVVTGKPGQQYIVLKLTDQFSLRGNPPLSRRSLLQILLFLPVFNVIYS